MTDLKATLRGLALLAPAVLLASACAATAGGSANGSGWIISSQDPRAKADFGFAFDCGKDPQCLAPKASGNYQDGVVRMTLDSVDPGAFGLWPPTGPIPDQKCVVATVNYSSANPKVNGSGKASVNICDASHGKVKTPDTFAIQVTSGPYAGYQDSGPLGGGQITVTPAPTTGP